MTLQRTPLYDWHVDHRGRMVEFGGWDMPVQYSSIVEEHNTVRHAVGLFDISHMGRLEFKGPDSVRLLGQLLTCKVDNLIDGQIRYGLICKDNGGILDDILVNRIDAESFGLVVNASNRDKIVAWIDQQIGEMSQNPGQLNVAFHDRTMQTAMIAVQGPKAISLVEVVLKTKLTGMKYYTGRNAEFEGTPAFVSRTGYTGEDGFEVIIANEKVAALWGAVVVAGQSVGLKPCGLGCRDTLRLEAAMPLYGHELNENVDPLTAGLSFAVKLDKPSFNGRKALQVIDGKADRPVRVGLKLASRRIAREHSEVYAGENRIGEVTSGTFSPTLEQSIAMAYVEPSFSTVGVPVTVDIRGKREVAEVVPLPFYKRQK